jgi:hypothetical protein
MNNKANTNPSRSNEHDELSVTEEENTMRRYNAIDKTYTL